MTSFLAWVGVDSRGPTSVYLSSDSRISWIYPNQALDVWDHGRKVFATTTGPHLFGYVGDVLFASLVLSQLTSAADAGLLFAAAKSADARFGILCEKIQLTFGQLPKSQQRDFSVVYATRDGEGMRCGFSLWVLHWSRSLGWRQEQIGMPMTSSSLSILGSGTPHVELWQGRWRASSQGDTSRAVFSAFCDAIQSGADKMSGGPPQLVGLYRVGTGRTFGIVTKQGAFVYGLPVTGAHVDAELATEWRNEAFERVDACGDRLHGAQDHHVPRGLGPGKHHLRQSGGA
jgi:hypothetical protein